MTTQQIPNPKRVRKINGSFGFIPHRFLQDGFLSSLTKNEMALYLFWVLAANRFGTSYYGDTRICRVLDLSEDELRKARTGLIEKDLINWKAPWIQVLELPVRPLMNPESKVPVLMNECSTVRSPANIDSTKPTPMEDCSITRPLVAGNSTALPKHSFGSLARRSQSAPRQTQREQ